MNRTPILILLTVLLAAACGPATPEGPIVISGPDPPTVAETPAWIPPDQLDLPEPVRGLDPQPGEHVLQSLTVTDPYTGDPLAMDYWVWLPPDYTSAQQWPAILYLHGSGQEGGNPHRAIVYGLPPIIDEQARPFVLITPHFPANTLWEDHAANVDAILQTALDTLSIDPDRVYLTGVSAGGYATWAQALATPERFAAVVSVSGSVLRESIPSRDALCPLADVPLWGVHGAQDTISDPQVSAAYVDYVAGCDGADVRWTLWADTDHFTTVARLYGSDDFYAWLLERSR
ncbi:MAG: prolyl oligopeptidase family serine peptidase [Chloroflexi bacterium]|nr:prolyl oligopeptidase family serine peptidase [Chloroflexota bacterium]